MSNITSFLEKKPLLKTFFNWKFASTVIIGLLIFLAVNFFNEGPVLALTFSVTLILTVYLFVNFPKERFQKAFYILIYLMIVSGLLIWYYTTLAPKPYYSVPGRPIPPQIKDNFEIWAIQASLLRIIYVVLGLVATTCSILAASSIFDKKDTEKKSNTRAIFMIISAVSFSILSAFDLGDKANRERIAWRNMNVAIIKYQQGIDPSLENLLQAYENAEKVIGDVKPSPKEIPR